MPKATWQVRAELWSQLYLSIQTGCCPLGRTGKSESTEVAQADKPGKLLRGGGFRRGMKDLERARGYMWDKRLEDTGRGREQLWGLAAGQHSGRWARRSHGGTATLPGAHGAGLGWTQWERVRVDWACPRLLRSCAQRC